MTVPPDRALRPVPPDQPPGTAPPAQAPPPAPPCTGRRALPAHATADAAPPPTDLRLLPPAAAAWAASWWAVGLPPGTIPQAAGIAALLLAAAGALLLGAALRRRVPRHRADPRPGAGDTDAAAHPTASAALTALVACAALIAVGAHGAVRARDPLTRAASSGAAVVLHGTVTSEPRVLVSPGATTVLTTLRVSSIDGTPSRGDVLVLGGDDWLAAPMGSQVEVDGTLAPPEPGSAELGVLGRGARVEVTAAPTGVLGAVTRVRRALAEVLGPEPDGSASGPSLAASAAGGSADAPQGPWPRGARSLVVGVALGDDHALPADLREDMRTVSMTHLTAVSGQHVALVLGIALAALAPLPRRRRAAVAGLVLIALVVLVRPSGSVLRAAAMGAVALLAVAAGRRAAPVPAMCAGAVVLLVVDPWQSRSLGFALSVSATASILLGARPLAAALSRRLPRWLAAALSVPLVAQAACGPLLLSVQPSVGLWAVPANVLAAPPVGLATVLGLLAALVAPWWPTAAGALAWPALASCSWLVLIARFFAHLPGAAIAWPGGAAGAALLSGLELALGAVLLRPRHRRRRLRRRRLVPPHHAPDGDERVGGPWQS